jgi:hypothetical protein
MTMFRMYHPFLFMHEHELLSFVNLRYTGSPMCVMNAIVIRFYDIKEHADTYKVLDWKPNYKHVFPECLKAYQSHLFDDAVSFAKCRELTALFKKHQALVLPGTLSTVVLRNDVTKNNLEWFIDAQCRLIDMNNFEDTREVDFDADFGERDDEEDYEKLTLSQLIATPSVPPLIRKGEAFEAFRSLYGDVCNHVHKVDEGIRKLFDEHFGALRRDILRYKKKLPLQTWWGPPPFLELKQHQNVYGRGLLHHHPPDVGRETECYAFIHLLK